jgi:hypothetical protein
VGTRPAEIDTIVMYNLPQRRQPGFRPAKRPVGHGRLFYCTLQVPSVCQPVLLPPTESLAAE